MSPDIRLRVVSPFLALRGHRLITVQAGSIVSAFDDLHKPGFHSIFVEHQELYAFSRDILDRTELIDSVVAVGQT